MGKAAKVMGFTLALVVGVLGLAFASGYVFTDLDLGLALALTAAWLVPTVLLSALALARPDAAERALLVVAVAVVGYAVVDGFLDVIDSDDWGPVLSVMDLALGVSLGFLGLRRPARAGLLLVGVGLVQLLLAVANIAMHATGVLPPGPGLGGSLALVVLWLLAVGGLFRLAGDTEPSALPPRAATV